jgi:hypothetical protein
LEEQLKRFYEEEFVKNNFQIKEMIDSGLKTMIDFIKFCKIRFKDIEK